MDHSARGIPAADGAERAGRQLYKRADGGPLDQVLNKKLDARLAAFLLEAADRENSDFLSLTHEAVAGELGSAREVISRMMKYLQSEGMVAVSRGCVQLVDRAAL